MIGTGHVLPGADLFRGVYEDKIRNNGFKLQR